MESLVQVLVSMFLILSANAWAGEKNAFAGWEDDESRTGTDSSTVVFSDRKLEPIYLDVESNRVTIYEPPFRPFVVQARDLLSSGNDFEKFLDWLEDHKDIHYAVLLLRPDSAKFQRRLRQLFRERGIDVGFDLWDEGREIDFSRKQTRPEVDKVPDSADDKTPVFFECRNNQLFFISLKELGEICDGKTEALKALSQGNESEFLKLAAQSILSYNGFSLDYTYALMGRYVLMPEPGAEGYKMESYPVEDETMWFGSKLAALHPETVFICFFVRPDSFRMFQMARDIARMKGFTVACELQDVNNPIVIGSGGDRVLPQ